jgi:hypothetical protein
VHWQKRNQTNQKFSLARLHLLFGKASSTACSARVSGFRSFSAVHQLLHFLTVENFQERKVASGLASVLFFGNCEIYGLSRYFHGESYAAEVTIPIVLTVPEILIFSLKLVEKDYSTHHHLTNDMCNVNIITN